MGVRLIEMRRILKDTGSLYLHCDPTASHYLKALMDAVFGDKNFRNDLIWAYTGPSNTRRWFPRKHDNIMFYVKSDKEAVFNRDDVRVPYVKLETGKTSGIFKQAATLDDKGKVVESWWPDITPVGRIAAERVGYPTQKPLALYERIIKASSNPGDMVLDPFCGCATTPVAAERLRRQWVGMDLWDGAYEIVKCRMEDNRQLLADPNPQIILRDENDLPIRTDGGEDAPTFELQLQTQRPVERWQKLSHAEMRDILYDAQNGVCAGCGRELEKEFMELDHKLPRADGGANDITNRIMLCSPCNRKKSHTLTLSGLVRENKKSGWMKSENRARQASSAARLKADMIKNSGLIK